MSGPTVKPYEEWPTESVGRSLEVEVALGKSIHDNVEGIIPWLLKHRYRKACSEIDASLLEALVRDAMWRGVYQVMMVLDGVAGTQADPEHPVSWELTAQIQDDTGKVIEEVNVLPEGDGLCYAFHEWFDLRETFDPETRT